MKKGLLIVGAALVVGSGVQAAYTPFHVKQTHEDTKGYKENYYPNPVGYYGSDTDQVFGTGIQKGDLKNWAFHGGIAAGLYGLYKWYQVPPKAFNIMKKELQSSSSSFTNFIKHLKKYYKENQKSELNLGQNQGGFEIKSDEELQNKIRAIRTDIAAVKAYIDDMREESKSK